MLKHLSCILLLLALAACLGPRYETQYRYLPPATPAAQSCTAVCLTNKTNCDLACTTQQAQCTQRARFQDQRDDAFYRGAYWQNGTALSAYRPYYFASSADYTFCRADACLGVCRDSYHDCYRACGGNVTEQTRCLAHCPSSADSEPMPQPMRKPAMHGIPAH